MCTIRLEAQKTQWNGFMDINTLYTDDKVSFNLGQLDIYVTSEITDNLSFLNETTFTVTERGDFVVKIERAIIKYNIDHYLNFHIGKHHTPISYWNDSYHHGRVLQPSAGRPLLFSREIFPMHITGIIVSGDFIGNNNFGYNVMLANGIGSSPLKDNDHNKLLGITFNISPWEDFKIVTGSYLDKISKGVSNMQDSVLTEDVNQNMYGLSITYMPLGKEIEFLSELFYVINNSKSITATENIGCYLHVGYTLGKYTPYYRFDYVSIDNNDPFFHTQDVSAQTIGLRYSFSYLANIKLEYQLQNYEILDNKNSIVFQFGIGF